MAFERMVNDVRLIDADAFEKYAWSNPDIVVDGDGYVLPYAASNFAEEHTIDAVPVVRCEGYRHFRRNLENDTYFGCVGGLTDPEEQDFCSYGEKRGEGK